VTEGNPVETKNLTLEPERPLLWAVKRKAGGERLCRVVISRDGENAGLSFVELPENPDEAVIFEAAEAALHVLFFDSGFKTVTLKTGGAYGKTLKRLGFKRMDGNDCPSYTIALSDYFPCAPFNGYFPFDGGTDGGLSLKVKELWDANREHPRYRFAICVGGAEIGLIDFRPGIGPDIALEGNIGFSVDEAMRGNGYAGAATALILPLAARHGMKRVLIANHPTNLASVRVCEKLGARLVRVAHIPQTSAIYAQGRRYQNIFALDI
jgi:hypothetical protein